MTQGYPHSPTLFPYTSLFRSLRTSRWKYIELADGSSRALFDLHRDPAERKNVAGRERSEEHTSELQSHSDLVCRLLLEKKKQVVRQCVAELAPNYLRFAERIG